MDIFLWWSGVAAWGALGFVGLLVASDWVMDIIVANLWTKREFMAFVWSRLKARNPDKTIPGG